MAEEDPGTIPIDIVGDVVCPYCFMGLRLVNAVVTSVPGLAVDIRWFPYQIDQDIPAGGMDRQEYLVKKFGADKVEETLAKMASAAEEFGLALALDRIQRQPNTLDAHRLIRMAYGTGLQPQIAERLFQAFFLQGQDIGDRGVLLGIAAKARMDVGAVEAIFNAGQDVEPLIQELAAIRGAGVDEVPRFTFAGKQDIVGLQPADTFADALFNSIEEG
ncbi:DsbA family oxidoreductase [Methyloferula stellata]|uniref:DsbA family oxidoreductase n=1 Tax=Methyloferula stellata TaxID=876270 RepID=UPI00036C8E4E|nr:DsbA family oxidoreductase [Methyloferula stellata]